MHAFIILYVRKIVFQKSIVIKHWIHHDVVYKFINLEGGHTLEEKDTNSSLHSADTSGVVLTVYSIGNLHINNKLNRHNSEPCPVGGGVTG